MDNNPTKKRRLSSRRLSSRREPEININDSLDGFNHFIQSVASSSSSSAGVSFSLPNQQQQQQPIIHPDHGEGMEIQEEQGPDVPEGSPQEPENNINNIEVEVVDAVPINPPQEALGPVEIVQQQPLEMVHLVAAVAGPSSGIGGGGRIGMMRPPLTRAELEDGLPIPIHDDDDDDDELPGVALVQFGEIGAGEPSTRRSRSPPGGGQQLIQIPRPPPLRLQQIQLLPPCNNNRGAEEQGWQESRGLLKDRAAYLLNNQRMSDVRFLVGEERVEMYGHKTILAMGSGVFEAQFFGSLSTNRDNHDDVIELPDFEPQTFLLFLKYLYTDTLEEPIDDVNKVLNLIKPAKKYIVPHLIEKCSDILMSELRPENIFQVHNYADFFDLSKLGGACLRFIDRESEAIVQTEEFTMLNSETLASFLRRDGLNISEIDLFKAVLRWAEFECERNNIDPTDANIRDALADNLRLVRFPAMTPEEFATEVAPRSILSAEEAKSIFIYMCTGYHNRMNPAFIPLFPIGKRGFYPQQYLVSRFGGDPTPHSLNYRSGEIYTYRFNIKPDRQIFFKGVNIFSIKCLNAQYVDQRRFNGAVYLYECDPAAGDRDLTREKGRKQFSRDGSLESEFESRLFPVLFDTEVRIPANQTFTVCTVVSVASCSYQQQPLNTFMGMDELTEVSVRCAENLIVNFTFSNSAGESSVGRYTQSQIPEIVFSL